MHKHLERGAGLKGAKGPMLMLRILLWNGSENVEREHGMGGPVEGSPGNAHSANNSLRRGAAESPSVLGLANYPNPSNGATTFRFTLAQADNIRIAIMDSEGREVAQAFNGRLAAGEQTVEFSPGNYGLAAGTYFYRVSGSDFEETGKMLVQR